MGAPAEDEQVGVHGGSHEGVGREGVLDADLDVDLGIAFPPVRDQVVELAPSRAAWRRGESVPA